jgi:hypothetical protein
MDEYHEPLATMIEYHCNDDSRRVGLNLRLSCRSSVSVGQKVSELENPPVRHCLADSAGQIRSNFQSPKKSACWQTSHRVVSCVMR